MVIARFTSDTILREVMLVRNSQARRSHSWWDIHGAAKKRPPTKTAISQNSLDILLRNFVRLFSRVDCITTAHIILLIYIEIAGSEIQSTIFVSRQLAMQNIDLTTYQKN